MDRLNSAVSHLDKAIAILGAQTQHDSFTYLGTLGLRGVAHLATRDADQALRDFDETVRGYEKLFGAEHEETLIKKRQRAVALAYAGKTARARAEIAPVVELYRARFSEPLYLPGETYLAAGTVERLAGNDDAARVFLQEAMDATEPGDSAATQRFRSAVLTQRGLLDLQSPDPGPTLALKHLQAADELQQKLGQGGPRRADVLLGMGRAQMSLGSARRALKFLQQADEIWQAVGIRNRWAGEAAAWRALALHELGRARDAQPVRARAVALLSTSEFASDIALVKALREMR
jgi:tetratricopeptide (TPR) repeat protein